MKKHFAAAGTRSQVLQALALLVESGSIYCIIMVLSTTLTTLFSSSHKAKIIQIFCVIYEIDAVPLQASAGITFYKVAAYITRGCVIPLAVCEIGTSCHYRIILTQPVS